MGTQFLRVIEWPDIETSIDELFVKYHMEILASTSEHSSTGYILTRAIHGDFL